VRNLEVRHATNNRSRIQKTNVNDYHLADMRSFFGGNHRGARALAHNTVIRSSTQVPLNEMNLELPTFTLS